MTPQRGEVWQADLGLAAKVRPVLVLSGPFGDQDYALISVIPHTTNPRGAAYEIALSVSGLKTGAFNVQGMLAVPAAKFLRRIAALTPDQIQLAEAAVRRWLVL